jgi:predicted RNase H-like HicB family nuclease
MYYVTYLHKDHKGDFGVSFPDFPGCTTAVKNLAEVQQAAQRP